MTNSIKKRFGLLPLWLVTLVLSLGCKEVKEPKLNKENSKKSNTWTLIFKEEFDQDLSQWNAWNSGAFNEEIQMYLPQQLSLENGILKIDIERKAVSGATIPTDSAQKDFEYVSGRIESKMLFGPSDEEGEREYRFVARIKLPAGHGMWPAFWTYGHPWPTQGEIDILEARGGKPNEYLTNLFYGPEPGFSVNKDTDILHQLEVDVTAEFHEYEMIWRANTIEVLFDGKTLHTYEANSSNNIEHFFGKKQMVVLNTAVGGIFFEDRNSANYTDSSVMEVDWVRVYKR